jgi:type I restriction enzyme S subunit
MAMLNKNDFSNLKFYFPKLLEQQKIADCLSSLDNLIEVQNKNIQILKTHKKGLMQQLFVNSEVN